MQIKRIAIRNLRRLREPVLIEDLQPGLNVIAGDNEEGKSTLLHALRAALFDRHNLTGAGAAALQPFGSSVRPEVELDFALGGDEYRLFKAFCQRPEADLRGPGVHQTGPAAEETLRELLGFESAARGASTSRQQGLWGLLWVEQGTAFHHIDHNERSRATLQATLQAEVGDVLGGRQGQALLDSVRQAYDAYYTATGKPRGELKQARERVDGLRAELERLDAELHQYEDKVDRLQRLEDEAARFEAEGTQRALLARMERAREQAQALERLRGACEAAEQTLRITQAEQEAPRNRYVQREQQRRQLDTAQARATELSAEVEALGAAQQQARARLQEGERAQTAAEAQLKAARSTLDNARARLRAHELRAALAERRERLEQAERAERAAATAEAAAAAVAIDQRALEELRELEAGLVRAQAALQAGATRVELALRVPVRRDGEPVKETELAVTARTELSLEGVGSIVLEPGGRDLAQAQQECGRLAGTLTERLQALGADTLRAAESALVQRQAQLAEADSQRKLSRAHAPAGVAALRAEIDKLQGEAEALGEFAPDADAEAAAREVEPARQALAAAEQRQQQAAEAVAGVRQQHELAAARLLEAQTLQRQNQDECERLREQLAEARRAQSDDELFAAMSAAERAVAQAQGALEQARQALQAADPERVRLELGMAEDALKQAELAQAQRERATRDLRIELQSVGQLGLGETRAECEGEWRRAELAAEQLEAEAGAVRVLHEALQAAAREARETFLGPVMERVEPYLRLLMPEAELALDQELGLVGLRRDGMEEPFESLSIGTREQLAIVVRLAFADLLADQGQPVTVILDDALVYADDGRLQRMQYVLRRAAERVQVLLLTCRERDYLGLGAPIRRLADCKTAAQPVSS